MEREILFHLKKDIESPLMFLLHVACCLAWKFCRWSSIWTIKSFCRNKKDLWNKTPQLSNQWNSLREDFMLIHIPYAGNHSKYISANALPYSTRLNSETSQKINFFLFKFYCLKKLSLFTTRDYKQSTMSWFPSENKVISNCSITCPTGNTKKLHLRKIK